jgi:hypothetical protein
MKLKKEKLKHPSDKIICSFHKRVYRRSAKKRSESGIVKSNVSDCFQYTFAFAGSGFGRVSERQLSSLYDNPKIVCSLQKNALKSRDMKNGGDSL